MRRRVSVPDAADWPERVGREREKVKHGIAAALVPLFGPYTIRDAVVAYKALQVIWSTDAGEDREADTLMAAIHALEDFIGNGDALTGGDAKARADLLVDAPADELTDDGKAAMILTLNVVLNVMKDNAADKQGLPDDKIGWLPFPTVAGGKGNPGDVMGNLNGWIVTKDSPKETVDFLRFFSEADNQRVAAEKGLYIPPVTESMKAISRPLLQQTLQSVKQSQLVQVNFDQALGPLAGAVVNDMASNIAAGRTSPADAANAIQQAWRRAASN